MKFSQVILAFIHATLYVLCVLSTQLTSFLERFDENDSSEVNRWRKKDPKSFSLSVCAIAIGLVSLCTYIWRILSDSLIFPLLLFGFAVA